MELYIHYTPPPLFAYRTKPCYMSDLTNYGNDMYLLYVIIFSYHFCHQKSSNLKRNQLFGIILTCNGAGKRSYLIASTYVIYYLIYFIDIMMIFRFFYALSIAPFHVSYFLVHSYTSCYWTTLSLYMLCLFIWLTIYIQLIYKKSVLL